ncbi:polyprenyl diphosphate synthase [Vulgatibacter incomptus]|uniref:Isoprenyl transferase n=1 Tax=Vulgatibacter incomptus TaxID=1391653 RepID=A0A0K1PE12_9BACT|nr:polyprenyl diphosphate synthase [Vulgatibacter incomptus]AKU91364.1 Undecaprenyl diphosphate synthase [Vulgatibacter incomptus]
MTQRETDLRAQLAAGEVPAHVGIIMDGNGRWAELRGLPRLEGHRVGSESVRAITTAAREVGVKALTLYAFSAQNWARPGDEVEGLMELLRLYLLQERPTVMENGIRLRAVGDLDALPAGVREVLNDLARDSSANDGMILTLALSYGGREELVHAARRIAEDVAAGRLRPADVDAEAFASRLHSAALPDLDLCIRTSGELRVSNFLPWQIAYAEILVTEALWPEFREEAFFSALLDYRKRERRFGLTGAQVRGTIG